MPYQNHQPWDHFPIHLSLETIANPHPIIKEFFDCDIDIVDLKKELKSWWRSAFSNKCLLNVSEIVSLVGLRDQLLKVIDAAYVLHDQVEIEITPMEESEFIDPASYCGIPHDNYTAWDYLPRYLGRMEFVTPHLMLSKFFAHKNLPEWRDTLEELFSSAISECNIYSCSNDEEIYKSCDYIIKLMEALYLIKVRFIDKNKTPHHQS